jgi:hypothetical protein
MADDDWKRTRQHKFISNLARVAAKVLKQEREWSITPQEVGQINCPSCNSFVSSKAVVCGNCNYILKTEEFDPSRYAAAR